MRILTLVLLAGAPFAAADYREAQIESKLVPGPAQYAVLVPDGYEAGKDPLPLILNLHGGGGNRDALKNMRGLIEELWRAGTLPPAVIATPSAGRSFYMDFKDGSQKWETFLLDEFIPHLRKNYGVRADRQGTLLYGVSMGGLGGLRLAFKYPERFAGVAALEPGIDPVLKWRDLQPRNKFWRAPELMEQIFGKPFDEEYWERNNVATIAVQRAATLRSSGIKIYIECGDEDAFNLHEATEFLHQILWKEQVRHEYHLVHGADHLGRTLRPRMTEAFEFLARVIKPPGRDPVAEDLQKKLAPLKKK